MGRNYIIYAVDFDGTLAKDKGNGNIIPNKDLINHLKKRQLQGNKVILWTCRFGDSLHEAIMFCESNGLIFDAINDNIDYMKNKMGGFSRKIYADVYIDDHMINKPKYHVPFTAE